MSVFFDNHIQHQYLVIRMLTRTIFCRVLIQFFSLGIRTDVEAENCIMVQAIAPLCNYCCAM